MVSLSPSPDCGTKLKPRGISAAISGPKENKKCASITGLSFAD